MLPNTLPGAPFPRDVALVRTRRRSSVRQQKGGWCAPDAAHGEPPARRPRVAFPGGLGTQPASRGAALPSQLLPWVVRNCLPLAPPGAFVPSPDTRLRRSRSAPSPFHFLLLTEGGCHSQGGSAGGAPAPLSPPSRLAGHPAPLLPGPHVENRPPGAGGPPARAAAAWTADVGRPSPRTSRAPRSPPLPHVYSVCRTSQGPPACRRREGGEL